MMAPGIAAVLALAGLRTTLLSRSADNAQRAADRAKQIAAEVIANGLGIAGQEIAIQGSSELEQCVGAADLVIESVYEDLELKRSIFERLDRAAPISTVLTSNTSGL